MLASQVAESQSPSDRRATADTDPWLTLQEGSAEVRVHEATLRREIKAKRLRHARVGGRKAIRIRRSWLHAWLEATSTPLEPGR